MVLGWGSKKAQVQHDDDDMSMEEILASIRKYVSEETSVKETADLPEQAPMAPRMDSPYKTNAKPSSNRSEIQMDDPVFAPKNTFADSRLFTSQEQEPPVDNYAVTRDTLKSRPALDDISQEAQTKTSQHNPFAKLAEASKKEMTQITPTQQNVTTGQTLDQLVTDLAKPMIQGWIDKNLTQIVEKMVADEISKMTGTC